MESIQSPGQPGNTAPEQPGKWAFDSQSTYILPNPHYTPHSKLPPFVYMGDRWCAMPQKNPQSMPQSTQQEITIPSWDATCVSSKKIPVLKCLKVHKKSQFLHGMRPAFRSIRGQKGLHQRVRNVPCHVRVAAALRRSKQRAHSARSVE